MAQNPPVNPDLQDPDHSTTELKARLIKLEDPLDPQLLENLSLFFKVKGANPVPLMKLYKECIISLEKNWEPFIATLGSILNEGVVACEYLMVKYFESSKVLRARDFSTMLSDIANFHNTQKESSGVTNASASSTLSSDSPAASLNEFIWEDGKSYLSKVGILTANRDGTIAFNISSSEYHDIIFLRDITMNPKNWEFILNRDLIKLISYLSLNSEKFEKFDRIGISQKAEILKDVATHVPVNIKQWSSAPIITGSPKSNIPCKLEFAYDIRIDGKFHPGNVKELMETICFMVLIDCEIPSKAAKQFIWNFISGDVNYKIRNQYHSEFNHRIILFEMDVNNTIKGISEGTLEEKAITAQTDSGVRTWELTDSWNKYVTVLFSYKLQYSTCQISEKKSLKQSGYKLMEPPSLSQRTTYRMLEMDTKLLNAKTVAEQSEFLRQFLYTKKNDSTVPLIPIE